MRNRLASFIAFAAALMHVPVLADPSFAQRAGAAAQGQGAGPTHVRFVDRGRPFVP